MEPTPEHKKLHPLAQLAKDTVESYVKSGDKVTPRELTPEMKERAGVFVSIKKTGMLRGCIGTFEPRQSNVAEEIMNTAVSSATQVPRFPPVDLYPGGPGLAEGHDPPRSGRGNRSFPAC